MTAPVKHGNPTVSNDPARCARCGLPVLVRGDGRALEPAPHAEGVYRPCGGIISPLDAVHALHGTGPAGGAEVGNWRTGRSGIVGVSRFTNETSLLPFERLGDGEHMQPHLAGAADLHGVAGGAVPGPQLVTDADDAVRRLVVGAPAVCHGTTVCSALAAGPTVHAVAALRRDMCMSDYSSGVHVHNPTRSASVVHMHDATLAIALGGTSKAAPDGPSQPASPIH